MKNLFLNRAFKNYCLMFLTMFATELIFRKVLDIPIREWSTLRVFIGINIISIFLGILYSFTGRVLGNILSFITSLIASIYAIAQAGFINYLGVYISLGTASQAGAVKDYIGDYIQSFKGSFYLILIPIGLLLIYYLLIERNVKIKIDNQKFNVLEVLGGQETKDLENQRIKKQERKKLNIIRIALTVILVGLGGFYYYSLRAEFMQNKLQLISTKDLFNNPEIPNIAVNQFGISVFGLLDIKTKYMPSSSLEEEFTDGFNKPVQEITDYTRFINDTAWEQIISEEKNSNYKKLSNYFISKPITPKNDYTGMFKGKNLIVIMMESTNNIAINKEYFPNLYKLYSEGWSWDNAYSPKNSCSTGNNEMSGMASLYTINLSCTANNYRDNTYFEAIFNLFNRAGYTTSSYHNNADQYYYRKQIHPNMGSMNYYNANNLGIPVPSVYQEWASDVTLMEKFLEKTASEEHYMAWITTVTAHQPYTVSSEYGDLYVDDFADTDYDISLKRYLSKLKVFDEAIGTLLDGLEKQGKLDDTVIVLYGDHYPYGLSKSTIKQIVDYDISWGYEIDRAPFIIYNSEIKPTKFKEYTSYMNILPTVANLFDLTYDPRLYSGIDILSDEYPNRVVFGDGSWRDERAFYNAATGKIKYLGEQKYTDEEIISINKDILNNIRMANLAITTNYFAYLGEKLQEYNSPLLLNKQIFTDKQEETSEENTTS